MTLVLAAVAGLLIGLSLGALGGGGSILAVPVLVYVLGESASQATTGSLVVVGVTALVGAVSAHRHGTVLWARGLAFGATAVAGAVLGARASTAVGEAVLLGGFSVLMLLVAALMSWRLVQQRRGLVTGPSRPDGPVLTLHPLTVDVRRAAVVLVTATAVGLLTGFLGVGGGFLVVPALVLALDLPMDRAAATSLVVIVLTSASAFVVRVGSGVQPTWVPVLLLTVAAAAGAVGGTWLAQRTRPERLAGAFTLLVLGVAVYTAARALPALA
ncbi:sulfite exporter TauE/SafE family protein [Nocardioides marmoribigeumensis]|uniref:Probable membrane transporter protein n=1 Tax=Nocardioides marmoribigeumensis TaxID=433649 RepID=A0ABU2BUB6_9ACTN|nr:sulfite exporter TauE/SafE family protein [Nocardioides marmoribigeumensis]MDR7362221.1 putative membrane protein YfcA [Nocardioides marmoribigeumensis]